MRNSASRLTGFARAVGFLVLAATTAAPAAAQFGGLKKKVKAAAGVSENKDAPPAANAGAGGGGTVVLSDDVVERLLKGLRAGQAYRENAGKGNTPYGQYIQAHNAYLAAKARCDAASQTWAQRMAADQKLMDKSNGFLEKMIAAQQKQDTLLQRKYGDSLMYLQDPSCVVKEPRRPDNWFDLEREIENQAEQEEQKAADLDGRDLGQAKERAITIFRDPSTSDVSASEKDAVKKREAELRRLMGWEKVPEARAEKPAPAAAAAPAPQPAPTVSPDQSAMNDCMMRNAQKHEKEIQRLGERAKVASEANDMQATMAIADSIRRLQMAGCEPK